MSGSQCFDVSAILNSDRRYDDRIYSGDPTQRNGVRLHVEGYEDLGGDHGLRFR